MFLMFRLFFKTGYPCSGKFADAVALPEAVTRKRAKKNWPF